MDINVQSTLTLLTTLVELLKLLHLGSPITSTIFAIGFAILAAALLIQSLNERKKLSKEQTH